MKIHITLDRELTPYEQIYLPSHYSCCSANTYIVHPYAHVHINLQYVFPFDTIIDIRCWKGTARYPWKYFSRVYLLYCTPIITRDHPVVIVAPHHRPNCMIMSLDKIEMHLKIKKWKRTMDFSFPNFEAQHLLLVCTWRIISKLNDCPFQRVNSPLCEPVIRRLPVGVH